MEKFTNHTAGIIPVSGARLNFGFDWHDCMMPVGFNYLAVERCALECAYAGCSSIWLVSTDNIIPLLRNRMRDFILDPIYQDVRFTNWQHNLYNVKNSRVIPIFYLSIPPKAIDRADSLAYSVVYGAAFSSKIASRVSEWVVPDTYYVSFPYGAYEPAHARMCRKRILKKLPVMLEYEGKTVRDNEYLGFSFTNKDIPDFMKIIKAGVRKTYTDENGELRNLPKEQQYEATKYNLGKVFGNYNPPDLFTRKLKWYYNISSWNLYRKFIGTPQNLYLNQRKPDFLTARHIKDFKFSEEE